MDVAFGWAAGRCGRLAGVSSVAVFVIDGHDIELHADAISAAAEIEGYDAKSLEYIGADGTVYVVTVEGPEWGPVALHPGQSNRLDELLHVLRREAEARGVSLAPEVPDDPEAIWAAVLAGQAMQSKATRRRPWTRTHTD